MDSTTKSAILAISLQRHDGCDLLVCVLHDQHDERGGHDFCDELLLYGEHGAM